MGVGTITAHEEARRKVDMALTKLASKIGVSHSYASRIEARLIPASERYRRGFGRAVGVATNEVFDESGYARVRGE